MALFSGIKKNNEKAINYKEENDVEDKDTVYNDDKNYVIKILLPSDQYGTEFLLYYVGENDTVVRNLKFAKSFENFEDARVVSNDITEKYKNIGIWVPSRVVVDKY